MTSQETKQFVRDTLVVPRSIAQEILALDSIIDLVGQSDTTGIPAWDEDLTFQLDGSDDGSFCTHPASTGALRFWKTKVDDNEGNEPPTDPGIDETAEWIEVSPSTGSAIKEWTPGLYGTGLIIVYYDLGSGTDPALYILAEATRPFNSTDIAAEITAGSWKKLTDDHAETVSPSSTRTGPGGGTAGIVYERILADFVGAVSTQVSLLDSAEISDGESVAIKIFYTVKRDSNNTGGAGEYLCNWTKAAGVLVQSFEDDTRKGNNSGGTITVSTLDVSGNIRAEISNSGSYNMSGTWFAQIIRKH